jgi:hypothetical protein
MLKLKYYRKPYLSIFLFVPVFIFVLSSYSIQKQNQFLSLLSDENSKLIWKHFTAEGAFTGSSLILFNDSTYKFSIYTDVSDLPPCIGRYKIDSNSVTVFGMKFLSGKVQDVSFLLTKWGKMEVLLEKDDLTNICNLYNHGFLPVKDTSRIPDNIISVYHEAKAPYCWLFGKPDLPEPWNHYLLTNPIHAKVTRIDTVSFKVWINKGLIDSLFIGCELYSSLNAPPNMTITNISLNESECEPSDDLEHIYRSGKSLLRFVGDSLEQKREKFPEKRSLLLRNLYHSINWLQSGFAQLDTNTYFSTSLEERNMTKP